MTAVLTQPTFSAGLKAYLGLLQFVFLASWIVYVIFLGDLLARLGVPKDWLPRLLLADQILFLVADVLLGHAADRWEVRWGRIAPVLVVLNLVSCLAFAALPQVTAPSVFITLTVVWVLTASVLRAPLYGLIARRSGEPQHGTAAALLGMGLASAAAPYLGQVLKGIDPFLPFMISAISLAAATLGFAAFERSLRKQDGGQYSARAQVAPLPVKTPGIPRLLAVALLLGGGFQLHAFVNSAPLYKVLAEAHWLPWLLPTFWTAFSIVAWTGGPWLERIGAGRMLAGGALGGSLAVAGSWAAPDLAILLLCQGAAGAAWAFVFLAGLTLAGVLGRGGREGLFVAGWFACMAAAAAFRLGLGMAALSPPVTLALATGLWLAGTALLLPWLFAPKAAATDS